MFSIRLSLITALSLAAACCSFPGVVMEADASLALGECGGGGAPASCDPPADCDHVLSDTLFCLSCPVDGVCPADDILPRGGLGDPCVPFLGPGGTAIDASCSADLWCSRCSGECTARPRDCGC
jgi:hypothetical protein